MNTCQWVLFQVIKDLLTISPEDGTVAPGAQQAVQVHFNALHCLQKEVTLANNADISLAILEPLTSLQEQLMPVKVSKFLTSFAKEKAHCHLKIDCEYSSCAAHSSLPCCDFCAWICR